MHSALVRSSLAAITLSVVVAGASVASASPHHEPLPQNATYLNGEQVPWGGGPVTVDRNGGTHALAVSASGWGYYTKAVGAGEFNVSPVDLDPDLAAAAITHTPDGTSIDIAVATCDAVKVFKVSADQRSLPALDTVPTSFAGHCSDTRSGAFPIAPAGMASLADGRVALAFVGDPAGTSDYTRTVYTGRPGGTFTRMKLGSGSTFSLTSDLTGNHAYLAYTEGTAKIALYTLASGGSAWQRSVVSSVRPGASKGLSLVSSVAASHGQLVIGLEGNTVCGVVRRDATGRWLPTKVLASSNEGCRIALAVSPNAATTEVWAALQTGRGPISTTRYTAASSWESPTVATAPLLGNASDLIVYTFDYLTVDWQGNPVLEYGQDAYPSS